MPSQSGPIISRTSPPHLLSTYQSNARSSPLLRLPAELRTRIFEYCLSYPFIVIFEHLTRSHDQRRAVGAFACDNFEALAGPIRHTGDLILGAHQNFLGLLQVCRQIYCEAHPIPFESKTFVFSSAWALHVFYIWLWDRNSTAGALQSSSSPNPEAITAIAVPNCISSFFERSGLRLHVEDAFSNLEKIYVYNTQAGLDDDTDAFYREWMQEFDSCQFIFL
ncbi:hypothetical protein IQ07DRAFT_650578 [Pyrenochaeta sp. DS3sAY3a]|nr:hypothetical protein IQ07DRAFT_650578 [Pyrenochaeta sp. DS3sAY3a]